MNSNLIMFEEFRKQLLTIAVRFLKHINKMNLIEK
jgi:hypothetical protein